jgi:Rhs element Vgr protein
MGQDNNIHINVEFETEGLHVTYVHGLKLQQHYDWHHQFELRFPIETVEGSNEISLNQAQKYAGKLITIKIKSQDGAAIYNTFKGIITEVSLTRHSGAATELFFKGFSPTILLDDGPNCQGFAEKSLSTIIKEVVNRYPVNLVNSQVELSKEYQPSYLAQYNESAWNFINRIANDYGQWCYYSGRELRFGKLLENDSVTLRFGHGLSNFETSMNVLPLNFEGTIYGATTNTDYYVSSDEVEVNGADALGKRAISESKDAYSVKQITTIQQAVSSQQDLSDVILARKAALVGDLVVVKGSSDNPALKIGTKVNIQGGRIGTFGSDTVDYGSYTIVRVSHYADGRGSYSNSFEAIPSSLNVPPYTTTCKMPTCTMQRAVVADNKDPKKLGRVRVRFPWQKDGAPSYWIRVTMPHAGANYGFYWMPEIGDEVKVIFHEDNPSRPTVLGSYMNGEQNSSDRYDDDNNVKTIRTKSGNEIYFNDKPGEERIHIHNMDKSNEILITMEHDGLIKIHSRNNIIISAEGDLDMSATNIKISASRDMAIEVKENFSQTVEMKYDLKVMEDAEMNFNKNLKENITLDHEVNASGKIAVTATGDIELAGLNAKVIGNVNANVSANAQLELSSSAQATLKAAMVMIN